MKTAKRIAFFICGSMTIAIGRVYGGLHRFAPTPRSEWLPFSYALMIVGTIAVCFSFLPTAWVQGAAATRAEVGKLTPFTPFRFLWIFAATGSLFVAISSFVPLRFAQPPAPLVYSLCPACVLTITVDPSWPTILFILAPLNALVFGAFGGVVGTAYAIARR